MTTQGLEKGGCTLDKETYRHTRTRTYFKIIYSFILCFLLFKIMSFGQSEKDSSPHLPVNVNPEENCL